MTESDSTRIAHRKEAGMQASTRGKKPYRSPSVRALGDFHTMTRTGGTVGGFQDLNPGTPYAWGIS